MEREVLLRILSKQSYDGEGPEQTELFTQGILSEQDGVFVISYAETELTGLDGTTTSFSISPERVELTRTGTLQSRMVFALGEENRSLYDMGFGALMITVRTQKLKTSMTMNGGSVEVEYAISIENASAGTVSYRIEVKPK